MNYNHVNNGCCGGSNSLSFNGTPNVCHRLGPFIAKDAACMTPGSESPSPVFRATGSIIQFASGVTPVVLSSVALGLVGTTSHIGFGTAVPGVALVGGNINLTGLVNQAFSVPRAGNLTAISASFTETLGLTVLGTATIKAQIYKAVAGSAIFNPTTVTVDLEPLTGIVTIGKTCYGAVQDLAPVQVNAGDRLLLMMSVSSSGDGILDLANVLSGTVSAGITID